MPGHGKSPKFSFTPNLIFFCDLKPHAKFWNPTITPSGRKVTGSEKKKKKRKNAINSGHLVPWQRTQAVRTKIVSLVMSAAVVIYIKLYASIFYIYLFQVKRSVTYGGQSQPALVSVYYIFMYMRVWLHRWPKANKKKSLPDERVLELLIPARNRWPIIC